ncbi:MAG: HAMP domain-containing histidine kinase [Lachnospiraceae bacterium]|nr:HAMP domain-containing histidine kinase [Lachnospiraceae bacterium]
MPKTAPKESQMVKDLKKRFIFTAMFSLSLILAAMIVVIFLLGLMQNRRRADEVLTILQENGGAFPDTGVAAGFPGPTREGAPARDPRDMERPFETRYFTVTVDADGNILSDDLTHIAAVTEDDLANYAAQAVREKGAIESYRYLARDLDNGTRRIVFLDQGLELSRAFDQLINSLSIGMIALLAMYLLVRLFAGMAVKPIVDSYEKQKRFITDAGHELKTPLSVISASVDVMEMTGEKTKWTTNIRDQVSHMTTLINHMLLLSRMESLEKSSFAFFDASKAVADSASDFEANAVSKKITYTKAIEDNLRINGDENAFRQLCHLLLQNAMKYAPESGNVAVDFRQIAYNEIEEPMSQGQWFLSGRRSFPAGVTLVALTIKNTCEEVPAGDLNRLFDRFYRADSSRSKETGGSGIGLSVAKAIATAHGGIISAAKTAEHEITFRAVLPQII